MADCDVYCATCGENTHHLDIREARLRICSVCGGERRYGAREKSAAPVKLKPYQVERLKEKGDGLPAADCGNDGKRRKPMKHKMLTRDEINDIKLQKGEGAKDGDLAKLFGCSKNTIWRMCHGMEPKRVAGKKEKSAAGGTVREALETLVAEKVAEFMDKRLADINLDAKIEAVVIRLLK